MFLQRHFSHYKMPFIDPRFNEIENLASISSVRNFINLLIIQITILFGGLILLQGDDDQLGTSYGRSSKISEDNDLFKTTIIVLVLVFNLYFIVRWSYHLFNVMLRLHFSKLQCIFNCMNMKIAEVDDYETDLQKWRSMQESSSMNLGQSSPQYNSRINKDISFDHQKNQRKPPALI